MTDIFSPIVDFFQELGRSTGDFAVRKQVADMDNKLNKDKIEQGINEPIKPSGVFSPKNPSQAMIDSGYDQRTDTSKTINNIYNTTYEIAQPIEKAVSDTAQTLSSGIQTIATIPGSLISGIGDLGKILPYVAIGGLALLVLTKR